MTQKLFIKTHGCQMNEYDSSRMADLLGDSHGYELTQDENEADVHSFVRCSFGTVFLRFSCVFFYRFLTFSDYFITFSYIFLRFLTIS